MQNKIKQIIIILLFLSTITTQVYADTEIQFGNNKDQISIDKSSEGIWKPLFFDVDQNSNIHIPDFFKGRIAIFTIEGKLHKELQINEGISPRMNYFALNQDNTYTTYDNYSLYLLDSDGVVIWKKYFGLAAIPQHIFIDQNGIYIKFNNIYTLYSFLGKKIELNKDIFSDFSSLLVKNSLIYKSEEEVVYISNTKKRTITIDRNGQISKINVPQNGVEGSGYWVIRGDDRNIYTSLYYDLTMTITQIK